MQRRGPGGAPPRRAEGESSAPLSEPGRSRRSVSSPLQTSLRGSSGRVRGGPPNASRWLGRPAESAERGQARASPQRLLRAYGPRSDKQDPLTQPSPQGEGNSRAIAPVDWAIQTLYGSAKMKTRTMN